MIQNTSSRLLVSLIVPVWNAEPYLGRSLNSYLAQSLESLEIILVDSASSDASSAVCREFRDYYPERFRYTRLATRQSPGKARNVGLTMARGEFIGFADSDDEMKPGMLEALLLAAQRTSADVAVCGFSVMTPGSNITTRLPPETLDASSLLHEKRLMPMVWNKLFRRSLVERHAICFPDCFVAEDMAFVTKVLLTAPKLVSIPKPLYHYHKRNDSLSHTMENRLGVFDALQDIRLFIKKYAGSEQGRAIFKELFWLHAVYHPACLLCINALLLGENRKQNVLQTPAYLRALVRNILRNILQ